MSTTLKQLNQVKMIMMTSFNNQATVEVVTTMMMTMKMFKKEPRVSSTVLSDNRPTLRLDIITDGLTELVESKTTGTDQSMTTTIKLPTTSQTTRTLIKDEMSDHQKIRLRNI